MKRKKFFVTSAILFMVAFVCYAAAGEWKITHDEGCDKCKITNTEYTCGKCGSGMSSSCTKIEGRKMYYTFTCTSCNHTCKATTTY